MLSAPDPSPRPALAWPRRHLLGGAAAVTAAAALSGYGSAPAVAQPGATAATLPAPRADGISRGQIFDNQIPDRSVYGGFTYFVWGASSLSQPAGAVPSGYLPVFRDFDRTHTLAWYQANHPDWVAYTGEGGEPAWEFENELYVPLDIANPAVRTYYFDRFVQPLVDQGYPIIAFDNFGTFNPFGRQGHYLADGTTWVQQYSGDRDTDTAWAAATLDWLGYLSGRLHGLGIGVAANISFNASVQLADVQQAIGLVDVYVDEQGFTAHRPENYSGTSWKRKFDLIRGFAATKLYLAINQTTTEQLADATRDQVQWAIANYLLYREQKSMIALCGLGEYHVFVDRPELHTDLGTPASSPVLDSAGVWKRSYGRGRVLVNPTVPATPAANVTLPAGVWTDLYGTSYSGHILMPPNTGAVLTLS